MKSLGQHLLVEMYECDVNIINNVEKIEEIMNESVRVSGATIIKSVFHLFNPHGVSGAIVIAESHFTIHTWPEYGYCAVDIFTCGDTINNEAALKFLKEELKAKSISVVETRRGVLDLPVEKIKHKPDSQ